MVNKYTVFQ